MHVRGGPARGRRPTPCASHSGPQVVRLDHRGRRRDQHCGRDHARGTGTCYGAAAQEDSDGRDLDAGREQARFQLDEPAPPTARRGSAIQRRRSLRSGFRSITGCRWKTPPLTASGRKPSESRGSATAQSASPSSGPVTIVGFELSRDGVVVNVGKAHDGNYVLDRAGALRIARALRPVPLP